MKDENNPKAPNLLDTTAVLPKRGRGRPRKQEQPITKGSDKGSPATLGRPRQHDDAAAKQRAYRKRLKAAGKRVISRVVTDVRNENKPLESTIIDLSACRKPKQN